MRNLEEIGGKVGPFQFGQDCMSIDQNWGFKPCIFKHVDLVSISSRKMPPESHVK